MSFEKLLKSKAVPEWSNAYIKYKVFKKYLKTFSFVGKKSLQIGFDESKKSKKMEVSNLNEESYQKLIELDQDFNVLFIYEFDKITNFFEERYMLCLQKWRKLKLNMRILKQNPEFCNDKETKKHMKKISKEHLRLLQKAYEDFYLELILLEDYIKVNLEGFRVVLRKHRKVLKLTNHIPYNDIIFEKITSESDLALQISQLQRITAELELSYREHYHKNNPLTASIKLRRLAQNRILPTCPSIVFGWSLGILAMLMALIIIFCYNLNLNSERYSFSLESDFIVHDYLYIFPLFRGILLLICYQWVLAIDLYGWLKVKVDYRNLLGFDTHYSEFPIVIYRALFTSIVFAVMFLWYLLLLSGNETFKFLDFLSPEYTPAVVWVAYAFFILLPIPFTLNEFYSKLFFIKQIFRIFASPFTQYSFSKTWTVDQIFSFVIPLTDLHKTVVYYVDDKQKRTGEDLEYLGIAVALFAALLSLILTMKRMVQKRRFFSGTLVNFLKFFLISSCVVIAFMRFRFPEYLKYFEYAWYATAGFTSIFSSIWDARVDWGLLQPKSKYYLLRNYMSVKSPIFYYFAFFVNIPLRFAFLLSISPGMIFHFFPHPQLFLLVIGVLEMIRRCIWSFLAVESEDIKCNSKLRIIQELKIPVSDIRFQVKDTEFKDAESQMRDLEEVNPVDNLFKVYQRALTFKKRERSIIKRNNAVSPQNLKGDDEPNPAWEPLDIELEFNEQAQPLKQNGKSDKRNHIKAVNEVVEADNELKGNQNEQKKFYKGLEKSAESIHKFFKHQLKSSLNVQNSNEQKRRDLVLIDKEHLEKTLPAYTIQSLKKRQLNLLESYPGGIRIKDIDTKVEDNTDATVKKDEVRVDIQDDKQTQQKKKRNNQMQENQPNNQTLFNEDNSKRKKNIFQSLNEEKAPLDKELENYNESSREKSNNQVFGSQLQQYKEEKI